MTLDEADDMLTLAALLADWRSDVDSEPMPAMTNILKGQSSCPTPTPSPVH